MSDRCQTHNCRACKKCEGRVAGTVELSEEERDRLTSSLAWHFNCHADEPEGSYRSLGIQNALSIVSQIVAARLAAVEADRAFWKKSCERTLAELHEVRRERDDLRACFEAAEAEVAHLRSTFFASCPKQHEHGIWCGSDWAVLHYRTEAAEALVEAGLALADEWDDPALQLQRLPLTRSDAVDRLRAALGGAKSSPCFHDGADEHPHGPDCPECTCAMSEASLNSCAVHGPGGAKSAEQPAEKDASRVEVQWAVDIGFATARARDEEHARQWVKGYEDNPDAATDGYPMPVVVWRTVTTTPWTRVIPPDSDTSGGAS
jgi:hypothetical protein